MPAADHVATGPETGLGPGGVVRFGRHILTVGRTRYGYTIEVVGAGLRRDQEAARLLWRNGAWEARKLDEAEARAIVRAVLLGNLSLRELTALEDGPAWLASVQAEAMAALGYREAERSLEAVLTHRTSWTLTVPLQDGLVLRVDLLHVPHDVPTYRWEMDDGVGLQLNNTAVGTQSAARALVGDLQRAGAAAPDVLRVADAMAAQLPAEAPLTRRRPESVEAAPEVGRQEAQPPGDPSPPPPSPRPIEDARDAEEAMVDWMRWLGFDDAARTQSTRDGGIDIDAGRAVAQVKDQGNVVAPGPVRELFGVAISHGKAAVFFARAGYSKQALAFADLTGVALFRFNFLNEVRPVNDVARGLWSVAGGAGVDG